MADDDMEDPVVHEVDVYLSKSLASNLYVLQYPLRPEYMSYEHVDHTKARVKPKHKMVELELGLNTKSQNYSESKGEQIAVNVEGGNRLMEEESYFASGMMDKQVLRSVPCPADTHKYAIGILKNDELHVTPVNAMVQMRPVFDYLDKADNREKKETAAKEAGGDSSQEEDEDVQQVTVKFARPESEEAKARRMASYEYVQRRREEEHWHTLTYHGSDDTSHVEAEYQLLYGAQAGDRHMQFHSDANQYLSTLLPKPDTDEQVKVHTPNSILSRQQLKLMPLSDAVRALLTNVKVVQFSKLMELLPEGTDPQAALRSLQQVAVMVQGCWVVKSEVLYPKDTSSPHSGVSCEHLIRGRDFVMWKFTHCKYVVRKEIASGLPSEDVKDILEQMSRLRTSKGWEFVYDYDREFVDRFPEVVQRQRLLWDAKYQSLSKHFKMPKDADKKAKELELLLMKQIDERPRRRRASSRSSPRKRTLSGRSMSDLSDIDMEADAAGDRNNGDILSVSAEKLTVDPMEVCGEGDMVLPSGNNSVVNNGKALNSHLGDSLGNGDGPQGKNLKQLRTELVTFAREVMVKRQVVTLQDLKREFYLKLSQVPQGHILSSGVSDKMLEEAVLSAGGFQLNKPLMGHSNTDGVFAYLHQGNRLDEVRRVLFSFLEHTNKLKSSPYISKAREKLEDEFSDAEYRKVLKDICESHGSLWYIKGTAPSS
ncbi:DNA-directed RNA polymerase III subunit RPC5-like [Littorina saxatilis]|uniref:DNA-directed RNA polymerase III subunit RPC5 C-terminal domain-containing protein n=1 Tax=Littorina saxatilis TaxID=31220 RepID=A0AAN9BUQ8_9CAEN